MQNAVSSGLYKSYIVLRRGKSFLKPMNIGPDFLKINISLLYNIGQVRISQSGTHSSTRCMKTMCNGSANLGKILHVWSTGNWTQGLTHTRWVLYPELHPSLVNIFAVSRILEFSNAKLSLLTISESSPEVFNHAMFLLVFVLLQHILLGYLYTEHREGSCLPRLVILWVGSSGPGSTFKVTTGSSPSSMSQRLVGEQYVCQCGHSSPCDASYLV